MKILELNLKNFGTFTDKRIRIEDGINLFYGENESGKSALHTFIRGMLFGMPGEAPDGYSGSLRFESGGKVFRIDRHSDRERKTAELVCEDDGEEMSVDGGDLEMILAGLNASRYENTVSIGQAGAQAGEALAAELKAYAADAYAAGNGLEHLQERKRVLEQELKASLSGKQAERERMEQETSDVWREVHRLEEEYRRITQEIHHRREKELEEPEDAENVENRMLIDELRPAKWRIHPVELCTFAVVIILAFVLLPRPWNFLVSIILFLASGIYVWNRMKVGKKQVKTAPELILEEISREEEKLPVEKLMREQTYLGDALREKQTQYDRLRGQLAGLDELSGDYREYDRRRSELRLAQERLNELMAQQQSLAEERLKAQASEILASVTGGKYTRLLVEDGRYISVQKEDGMVSPAQLGRGTAEQIYFALRMAAGDILLEEECPVILDDAFVYYDDARLKNVLRWLGEHKKQVIIFTCQKREAQLLREIGIGYTEL